MSGYTKILEAYRANKTLESFLIKDLNMFDHKKHKYHNKADSMFF